MNLENGDVDEIIGRVAGIKLEYKNMKKKREIHKYAIAFHNTLKDKSDKTYTDRVISEIWAFP